MAALAATQEHSQAVRQACERIEAWLEALSLPAIPRTHALKATDFNQRGEAGHYSRSIGVYNPSPATVYLGIAGGKATLDARAWSIPGNAALILPISVEDYEIGADPADLPDGDAVVFVLRFEAVQPFFFGAL